MKVLVACEESQRVTTEFRKRGHEAYSCDIIDCSGGHPEWHIKGDVLKILNPWYGTHWDDNLSTHRLSFEYEGISFDTCDGHSHCFKGRWDMIIAFPPCTYLSNAGAVRLYPKKGYVNMQRFDKGISAKNFFMSILHADCPKICVENPIPSRIYGLPKYTQVIQPYEYGHPFKKKTCLWLKGLDKLQPTDIITENIISWVSGGSIDSCGFRRENLGTSIRNPKEKSKTFPGVAKAMADQWGK